MTKRIALLLFGMSYVPIYKNPTFKKNFVIDFRNSIRNYQKFIFDYYKEKGYDIDVFFVTNEHNNNKIKQELIDAYKPVSHMFIGDKPDDTFRPNRNKKVQKVLELYEKYVNEQNISYEFIILTRFDLNFKIHFDDLPFNHSTLNIPAQLNTNEFGDRVDDNFYLIPSCLINSFKKAIDKTINSSSHLLISEFLTFCKPNYLLSGKKYLVRNIPIYEIVRTKK